MPALQSLVRAWVGTVTALTLALALPAQAQVPVDLTNLVTDDQAAHPARITDPGLVNAWGLSYAPTSPFWISANGTGLAEIYDVFPATTKVGLTVTIPGNGPVTGQVFNSTFTGGAFNGDAFLFVGEDGTISGWRAPLGTAAEILQSPMASNVYKGAAFASQSGNSYLYAANFRAGTIDVLKGQSNEPDLTGNFLDPNLPAGYAPFNIQNLGGTMYVTYAQQDAAKHDEVVGAGRGVVSKFDLQGNFIGRVAAGGTLDAPWGLALAPFSFGAFAGALLVGNFGDGRISAYNPSSGTFLGQLVFFRTGAPLAIDGLWALAPGNDGPAGSSGLIYFTAGPDGEAHGLLGVLTPETIFAVPEPSTTLLLLSGLAAICSVVGRRAVTTQFE